MDGNDSPNISCGDSYNQNMLTSSQNTIVDSCIVDSCIVEIDSYIVKNQTSSQNNQDDSCIVYNQDDSYIVNSQTSSLTTQGDSCKEDQPPWFEPYVKDMGERAAVLRRIHANNRVAESAELPTLAATNTRSILPKVRNFAEDMLQRQITVSLISETWEQASGNKKFEAETERLFELHGLMFVSCPRPSNTGEEEQPSW